MRLYPITVPNYMHIAMKRLKDLIWYGMKFFRHTRQDCNISFSADATTILALCIELKLTYACSHSCTPSQVRCFVFCQRWDTRGDGSLYGHPYMMFIRGSGFQCIVLYC